MRIIIGNIDTVVEGATLADESWLREYLAVKDAASKYRARFRKDGDGRLQMFNMWKHSFPTGLLSTVLTGLRDVEVPFEIVDARRRPAEQDPAVDLGWLRDYQTPAVRTCVGRTRGIVKAATGSGKTEIIVALVKSIPCRWLLLVHRTQLVQQAADRYKLRTGDEAGVLLEGRWDGVERRFVCASFATVLASLDAEKNRRLKIKKAMGVLRSKSSKPQEREKANAVLRMQQSQEAKDRCAIAVARAEHLLASVDGILCDEAHVVAATTTNHILRKTVNAYWRFGFSGTPLDRGDQRSIFAVASLGPQIHEVAASTLIEAGVLAKPEVNIVQNVVTNDPGGTYGEVYTECVVEDPIREALAVSIAKKAIKPGFLFVHRIEHGHRLLAALRRAGLRCEFAWGKLRTEERTELISRLVAGDLDLLVCSVVFTEGVDVPDLRSVINAAAMKSIILTLQRIGRGMRRTDEKSTFEVWDIVDLGQPWLEKHAKARIRAYKREGHLSKTIKPGQVSAQLEFGGKGGSK